MQFNFNLFWLLDDQVHLDYLEAGADIIITASYQVSSINQIYLFIFNTSPIQPDSIWEAENSSISLSRSHDV